MQHWKAYQEEAARIFRELGCIVETDAKVQGARAQHSLDVWVHFTRFGVQQAWVIECKLWQRSVPKEKVLALRYVVEDVGADRGILIAEAGHQAGAHKASSSTNITLTTLKDLRESAKNDLLWIGLSATLERAARVEKKAFSFFEHELWSRDGLQGFTMRPKPGVVDVNALKGAIADITLLQMGIEQAQLGMFPVPARFDESGEKAIRVPDLETFVEAAAAILNDVEHLFASQRPGGTS
jgi:hypothetical protein